MKAKPLYVQYELTTEEELQGRILSENQLAVLNNDLVDFLSQRLNLQFDGTNPTAFAQAEAERSGKILYIQWLLDQHKEALETLAVQVQTRKQQEQ